MKNSKLKLRSSSMPLDEEEFMTETNTSAEFDPHLRTPLPKNHSSKLLKESELNKFAFTSADKIITTPEKLPKTIILIKKKTSVSSAVLF